MEKVTKLVTKIRGRLLLGGTTSLLIARLLLLLALLLLLLALLLLLLALLLLLDLGLVVLRLFENGFFVIAFGRDVVGLISVLSSRR